MFKHALQLILQHACILVYSEQAAGPGLRRCCYKAGAVSHAPLRAEVVRALRTLIMLCNNYEWCTHKISWKITFQGVATSALLSPDLRMPFLIRKVKKKSKATLVAFSWERVGLQTPLYPAGNVLMVHAIFGRHSNASCSVIPALNFILRVAVDAASPGATLPIKQKKKKIKKYSDDPSWAWTADL